MLTNNPNKTKTIEKRWFSEIARKFKRLNDFMLTLPLSPIVINITADQQAEINAFMTAKKQEAIGIFFSDRWQQAYQTEAYIRGVDRADREIKVLLTAKEAAALPSLDVGATALINTTIHAAELDFLHDRSDTKLNKWLDELLFDTRSILHEQMGVVAVDDIHDAITARINVTTSRAEVIAVTEISQASQKSVVKEVEAINAQGGELDVVWISVMDSRVRHLHAIFHGQIMSNEQAARNITISPWRCRCGLRVVRRGKQPARQTAKYKKERAVLVGMGNN